MYFGTINRTRHTLFHSLRTVLYLKYFYKNLYVLVLLLLRHKILLFQSSGWGDYVCMKGAESLAFLFVNVPIGGPESRGWTSGRVAAREKMMFEHMYPSLKCQFSLFS